MTLPQMLLELRRMVDNEEITNDCCPHDNPADPPDFCAVCFILNLSDHVSLEEPSFTEETTDQQRQTLMDLFDEYADEAFLD